MTDERRDRDRRRPESPEPWRDEVDVVFEGANPNPDRVGCPGRATIVALARRSRAIGDPAYLHLMQCSPCYQEFRALRAVESGRSRTRAAVKWSVAAAAVLAIALVGTWVARRTREQPPRPPAAVQAAVVNTELDLRKYTVARSDGGSPAEAPVILQPARLNLTILLPVGSEPGVYQVRVLDSNLRPRASGQGSAALVDYVTTLKVPIDLSALAAGRYQLAIRAADQDWRLIPARVQ